MANGDVDIDDTTDFKAAEGETGTANVADAAVATGGVDLRPPPRRGLAFTRRGELEEENDVDDDDDSLRFKTGVVLPSAAVAAAAAAATLTLLDMVGPGRDFFNWRN
jgi:hypothetical protein